jgi:hypothetical protein
MTLGRKVTFGAVGLLSLVAGLGLCLRFATAGQVVFGAFAAAVVSIVTAVVLGNVGEHIAKRGQP